tara:strand:+ start:2924 stop:3271 length:348 start_codon:yes stop_codon:yes gene_type:complete
MEKNIMESEFYQLKVKKPNGEILEMIDFKGKNVLIVNTATKCGLAPQFEGLEALHQKYKDKGLVVLGFPSTQFGTRNRRQMKTIEQACKINHGESFQLREKVDVNGKNEHPFTPI